MCSQQIVVVPSIDIARGKGVPAYVQIRDAMRRLIEERRIPAGAALPPEKQLAEHFAVSRMTLRQALAELEREGLIERVQGVGTTVRLPKFKHETKHLTSFSEDIQARGLQPSSRVLAAGRTAATARVAAALGIEAGAAVDRLHRVRLAGGQAVGIHTSHLLPGLVEVATLSGYDSLYALLEARGTVPTAAEESLEAVASTEEEAGLLHVRPGEPLLLVTRTTYDRDDRPFELVYARYRADTYQYTVSLRRSATDPS
jgi:GntR family transcriptional regulator